MSARLCSLWSEAQHFIPCVGQTQRVPTGSVRASQAAQCTLPHWRGHLRVQHLAQPGKQVILRTIDGDV